MTQVLRVATLNIHKGLSQFNRRMVIHELREGLRALDADLVFLQEVQGMNERMALRFAAWPGVPQYEYLALPDRLGGERGRLEPPLRAPRSAAQRGDRAWLAA